MPRLDFNFDLNFSTLKDFKNFFATLPEGAIFSGHYLRHTRTGLTGEKKGPDKVYININGEAMGFNAKPAQFWNLLNNAPFDKTQALLNKANSVYDEKGSGAFYRNDIGYIGVK